MKPSKFGSALALLAVAAPAVADAKYCPPKKKIVHTVQPASRVVPMTCEVKITEGLEGWSPAARQQLAQETAQIASKTAADYVKTGATPVVTYSGHGNFGRFEALDMERVKGWQRSNDVAKVRVGNSEIPDYQINNRTGETWLDQVIVRRFEHTLTATKQDLNGRTPILVGNMVCTLQTTPESAMRPVNVGNVSVQFNGHAYN